MVCVPKTKQTVFRQYCEKNKLVFQVKIKNLKSLIDSNLKSVGRYGTRFNFNMYNRYEDVSKKSSVGCHTIIITCVCVLFELFDVNLTKKTSGRSIINVLQMEKRPHGFLFFFNTRYCTQISFYRRCLAKTSLSELYFNILIKFF